MNIGTTIVIVVSGRLRRVLFASRPCSGAGSWTRDASRCESSFQSRRSATVRIVNSATITAK